jgi:hypothetical protein
VWLRLIGPTSRRRVAERKYCRHTRVTRIAQSDGCVHVPFAGPSGTESINPLILEELPFHYDRRVLIAVANAPAAHTFTSSCSNAQELDLAWKIARRKVCIRWHHGWVEINSARMIRPEPATGMRDCRSDSVRVTSGALSVTPMLAPREPGWCPSQPSRSVVMVLAFIQCRYASKSDPFSTGGHGTRRIRATPTAARS